MDTKQNQFCPKYSEILVALTPQETPRLKKRPHKISVAHLELEVGQGELSRQRCGSGQPRSAARSSPAALLPAWALGRGWCGPAPADKREQSTTDISKTLQAEIESR